MPWTVPMAPFYSAEPWAELVPGTHLIFTFVPIAADFSFRRAAHSPRHAPPPTWVQFSQNFPWHCNRSVGIWANWLAGPHCSSAGSIEAPTTAASMSQPAWFDDHWTVTWHSSNKYL